MATVPVDVPANVKAVTCRGVVISHFPKRTHSSSVMQYSTVKRMGNRGGSSNNSGSSSHRCDSATQLRQTTIRLWYAWLGVLQGEVGLAEKSHAQGKQLKL